VIIRRSKQFAKATFINKSFDYLVYPVDLIDKEFRGRRGQYDYGP